MHLGLHLHLNEHAPESAGWIAVISLFVMIVLLVIWPRVIRGIEGKRPRRRS